MKLNSSKTKTMIVSRSRTIHPQSSLIIGGTVLKESDDLDILGVTFDSTMIFEKNLRSVSAESLLKDLVSIGSPGVFSMIDCSLGDAFGVLPCPFWSTVLKCGSRMPVHTLNYWIVLLMVPAFYLGACLSVTVHSVDLFQYSVC